MIQGLWSPPPPYQCYGPPYPLPSGEIWCERGCSKSSRGRSCHGGWRGVLVCCCSVWMQSPPAVGQRGAPRARTVVRRWPGAPNFAKIRNISTYFDHEAPARALEAALVALDVWEWYTYDACMYRCRKTPWAVTRGHAEVRQHEEC